MDIKLFDSELKVMAVLWRDGDVPAKHIAKLLTEEFGWNVNTTYTLIKRCIKKGAIERSDPGFMCHALVPKEDVQEAETNELINKIYDGSADKLFAALLGRKKLSAAQIEKLKQIVGDLECGGANESVANELCGGCDDLSDYRHTRLSNHLLAQKDFFGTLGHSGYAATAPVFPTLCVQRIFADRKSHPHDSPGKSPTSL